MANGNGDTIKLDWSKIIAYVMTTCFALLLTLFLWVVRSYAEKIDTIITKVDGLGVAVAVLQTQNTSTSNEIADVKESIKEVKSDIKEIGR